MTLKSLLCIFLSVNLSAQPTGKKYTFKEIGWSIVLPADFTAFPSADSSVHIVPGGTGAAALYKRLITAMNGPNNFSVLLSSCSAQSPGNESGFNAANQQAYQNTLKGLGQQPGFQIDTATSVTTIDGVAFTRFRMTTRVNNHIQSNYMTMAACHYGYYIAVSTSYYSKNAQQEVEAMLAQSKFSK